MPPKRSRKQACPNPLFLIWLNEWKKEAEEKGMNSKWTYAKAIASIKKYPLPLRSGREAKILENIGDGIAKRLDERVAQYLQDGGDMQTLHAQTEPELLSFSPVKQKRRNKSKVGEDEIGSPTELQKISFSPDAKHLKTGRKYIPKHRSGAYALIITLYQECQKSTYVGYMGKAELQEASQALCDKSFTMADAGSHYTAWSSMGTLIEKGFVIKRSSPAKYYITDAGCELAHQLILGNQGLASNNNTSPINMKSPLSSINIKSSTHIGVRSRERSPVPEAGAGLLSELPNIMQDLCSATKQKTSATIAKLTKIPDSACSQITCQGQRLGGSKITDPFSEGGRYAILQEQILGSKKRKGETSSGGVKSVQNRKIASKVKSLVENVDTNFGVVDLDESFTPPKEFNYWYVTDGGETTPIKSQALVTIDDIIGLAFLIKSKKADIEASGALFRIDETRHSTHGYVFAYIADKDSRDLAKPGEMKSSLTSTSTQLSHSSMIGDASSTINLTASKEKTVERPNTVKLTEAPYSNSLRKQNISKPAEQVTKPAQTVFDVKPLFTLKHELYDVILCVDTTETTGGGKMKKEMADKLIQSGLKLEVRKLQLGDFLWIAKEKIGLQREVMLDFIVERKRMDDLASSIVDGRFREQKFRLKSCGLQKLIYMVETYGSASHFAVPEATLRQAIMNTQVVDGLFVKETNDVFDSVSYLKTMTRHLIKLYENKTLHCVSMEKAKKLKEKEEFEVIIQNNEQYLISFQEFSAETDKNKVLTVREMFAKQLMQIKGVSAERVVAIVDKYPTPSCLLTAIDNSTTQHERENLLTNLEFGKAKKKVGAPISKQVFTLLNS